MTQYINQIDGTTMVFGPEVTHLLNAKGKYELYAGSSLLNVPDTLVPVPPSNLELTAAINNARVVALSKIDIDNDKIYSDIIGLKADEYRLVRVQAQAFKDQNYSGTVPAAIHSWAVLNIQSDKWAADYIISQAISWENTQIAIRIQRINYKTQIKNAIDLNSIQTWLDAWNKYLSTTRGALGI